MSNRLLERVPFVQRCVLAEEEWCRVRPRRRTRYLLLVSTRAFKKGKYTLQEIAPYADMPLTKLPEDLRLGVVRAFDPDLSQFREGFLFKIRQVYPPEKTHRERLIEASNYWHKLDFEIKVARLRSLKHRQPHLSEPGYVLCGDLRTIAQRSFNSFPPYLKNLLLPFVPKSS